MNSDFVGRNVSGVPTSGQNLGTTAIPWGTIRTDSLVLNGSSVDPSQLTAPQNRIISGKMRSSSNQPAFIVPNGAAASFILDGSPTNLVVDINGTTVTVNSDITKSSLTTAPSSQNTALVNDADAVDQEDTRTWGEDTSTKKITIDTVGTNITALVGKFASFKLFNGTDTEYFFAFVESATVLSKVRRGYFYNSSSVPMNRIVFSNNDVITLMSTAWAFIENDATTVDVTYNNPVWSFTSPSSPATGDYWYDMLNQMWKRYDGTTFQIINRTFIGMAILDSTNCVAARSQDFYAAYNDLNSIKVVLSTSEIITGSVIGEKVSIGGQTIDFNHSVPVWNITTDLAGTDDMYNPTEQMSTAYYLYIKDTGDTVISDISPYFRGEFYGHYHPHNPWRMVGSFYNDSSSDISVCADLVRALSLKVVQTQGQSFASGTPATVLYSNPVYDTHLAFNTGTAIFTSPMKKNYKVAANLYTPAGTTSTSIAIRKNGANEHLNVQTLSSGVQTTITISTVIVCDIGSTIDITYQQNTGVSYTADTSSVLNWLTIEEVRD